MSEESSLSKATDKLAYDAFGPSAKFLGEHLFLPGTKWAVDNFQSVLKKAISRKKELGLDDNPVPPRVLPSFIRSASVCEDDVVRSYLGGALCSARTKNGRDDRAVAVLGLVDGLSSYAVRAHCIVYSSVLLQKDQKLSDVKNWLIRGNGVTILFAESDLQKRMAFESGEDADAILEHAFVNLSAEDLTMQGIRSFDMHKTKEKMRFVHITPRGVELFCWGIGLGQGGMDAYFSNTLPKSEMESLAIAPRQLQLGIVSYA